MDLSTHLQGLFYLSCVFQYAMVEALQESFYKHFFIFFCIFSLTSQCENLKSCKNNAIVFLWFLKIFNYDMMNPLIT